MLPNAKSKEQNVSPRTAFASLSACCKAEKPDGLWGVSTDKWPHCLGQKQICSFSYISLQPSVSTGRTGAPDQGSALPASSEWSFLQMRPRLLLSIPSSTHSISERSEERYGHSWHLLLNLLTTLWISTRMTEGRNLSEQEEIHNTILNFMSSQSPSS